MNCNTLLVGVNGFVAKSMNCTVMLYYKYQSWLLQTYWYIHPCVLSLKHGKFKNPMLHAETF